MGRKLEVWVCEYSPVQQAFHIDTLESVLETNRSTVGQGLSPGFIPLYVTVSQEDAHAFVERWRCEYGR